MSFPETRGQGPPPLLTVTDLRTYFPIRHGLWRRVVGHIRAVDGVSFSLARGQVLGLVGESGSGKTTVGRTIVRLLAPTAGSIVYDGTDISRLNRRQLAPHRRRMQLIFQDPAAALHPRLRVGPGIVRALKISGQASTERRTGEQTEALRLMDQVNLPPEFFNRYPHELSGGQQQRIGIARALAVGPELLVLDEPTSALDPAVQAQILNLLSRLKEKLGLTYLFISHDLRVVSHICDRVAVMYSGWLVETAHREAFFSSPGHPYSQALMAAVPGRGGSPKERQLPGEPPSPSAPPPGCRFQTRCPQRQDICARTEPPLVEVSPGHWLACHLTA
ncbi:MAG: ABC transporter ATP-binding protein [Deltaproteobacteria bacterium]|nr:ABC transporter ATP-binding protein [Deltaproteobacteria bacterium]